MLPPTYVFEGMRALLIDHVFRADLMLAGVRAERGAVRRGACRLPGAAAGARAARAPCCRAATEAAAIAAPQTHEKPVISRGNGWPKVFIYIDHVIEFVTMLRRNKRAGGPKTWRLANLAGRRLSGGPVLSNGLYWLYEMSHAALQSGARARRRDQALFQEPAQSARAHHLRQDASPPPPNCSSARPAATASRNGASIPTLVGGERAPVHISTGLGAAVLPAAAFRAHVLPHAAPAAAEGADRRADVGPLRHAAARHGRGVPAQPRRLHHRLGRCAHGAAGGGPLRPRRLHRLRHQHAAFPRRRHAMSSRCASRRCRCWRRPR